MTPLDRIRDIEDIDWDFPDYMSSLFPSDINSLHWYPAAFVPQIPAVLIQTLSQPGDLVFDPFSGSGISLIEATRAKRRFLGTDNNPFAIDIVRAKLASLELERPDWFLDRGLSITEAPAVENPESYCQKFRIDPEFLAWFHPETTADLLGMHRAMMRADSEGKPLIERVLLSSILNRCSSQRDHYTYITDRCFPRVFVHKPAREYLMEQYRQAKASVVNSKNQFSRMYGSEWSPSIDGEIHLADSRELDWIPDGSVDLVVTSPPYLGVNDYIRSMRLSHLLFPENGSLGLIEKEIGARRKRHRKMARCDYVEDMHRVFSHIARILKEDGFLALIIGQGGGKVNAGDTLIETMSVLYEKYGFATVYERKRKIKFRRIQVKGVPNEEILILHRGEK